MLLIPLLTHWNMNVRADGPIMKEETEEKQSRRCLKCGMNSKQSRVSILNHTAAEIIQSVSPDTTQQGNVNVTLAAAFSVNQRSC